MHARDRLIALIVVHNVLEGHHNHEPLDLATRMMLEQVSRLSDGDYAQSAKVQLFLDIVDRATVSSTAFVSSRERPMHFNGDQTLSLRVVDPIADGGVWAIVDDGCHSCCHDEAWG